MSDSSLLARRLRVLGRHSPLFYDEPLHLVRGEGAWVYDADGRRYLDAYNNVPHVGHCHPRVVEALRRQAAALNTHTRYLDETVIGYAERLTALFDPSISTAVLCCTGSEANELALRIARDCTRGMGFIVTSHAYHGNTTSLVRLSPLVTPPEKRGPFVKVVPVMDPYRDRAGRDDEALSLAYAHEVQLAIRELSAAGVKLAGLLYCTAFSTEGLPTMPIGYLAEAVRHVRSAGGLFIADEVQAGFGRFGTCMWGHQIYGVTPDIVTLGKPMGNGHPLAGVVARPELIDTFGSGTMYFNTFGGNPVSAAVGTAVLDVLRDESLLENARNVGEYFLEQLRRLQAAHEIVGDARGRGLFLAVELVTDRDTKNPCASAARTIVNRMRDRGVLVSRVGPYENILKIRPPLIFSKDNVDFFVHALDAALASL